MAQVKQVWARDILDSSGIPTVEAACMSDTGNIAVSSVPSGTSTGTYEALELRDKEDPRFLGKGVFKAVENVNNVLGPAISGMDPSDQAGIDQKLIELDGTKNKSKYGANAILAVSLSVAKLAASVNRLPLYRWVRELSKVQGLDPVEKVPTPLFNMINGGLHGAGNLDFQEFWVIPASSKDFITGLRIGAEVYVTIGKNLSRRGAIHSVGNEGGYAPNLFTNADALEILVESISQTEYSVGRDVFLGLDVAANSFFSDGEYTIKDKSAPMDSEAMLEYYKNIVEQYKLSILEDPFHEDAWDSWKKLNAELSQDLILVGDDLLVTNPERVAKAIEERACNCILVKPNQIGTITETLKVIKMARDVNWKLLVSHRSGETNDVFIADFAVGVGADYVKFGAPARGERVAKYNRLSAIELELKVRA